MRMIQGDKLECIKAIIMTNTGCEATKIGKIYKIKTIVEGNDNRDFTIMDDLGTSHGITHDFGAEHFRNMNEYEYRL